MRSKLWWRDPTDEEKLANTRAEYRAYDALPKRIRTIIRCAPLEISARKTYEKWHIQSKNTTVTAGQLLDWLKEKGASLIL